MMFGCIACLASTAKRLPADGIAMATLDQVRVFGVPAITAGLCEKHRPVFDRVSADADAAERMEQS